MAGEHSLPTGQLSQEQRRYEGLTTIYSKAVQDLREAIKTLPPEQQKRLAGKIEVADCAHDALLKEFGRKP